MPNLPEIDTRFHVAGKKVGEASHSPIDWLL